MNLFYRTLFRVANRKLIEPQHFELTPLDEIFHVTSQHYEFAIGKRPSQTILYEHDCSTPAGVLKKPGIHILPEDMPEVNKREKYAAVSRQLQSAYENSFRNCKSPKDVFHLQRKIKGEIRNKLYFVGCLDGKKYKHLLKFRPYMEILAENTQKEYEKNGITVEALGEKIFPNGKVWLPTSEKYLHHYQQILHSITGKNESSFLDMGCGSGVLSYLFAKQFKRSKIFCFDKNPDAVRTSNLNAARMQYRNIQAFEFDLKKQEQFELKGLEYKLPKTFDFIAINPPWLISSKMEGESALTDGVYDDSDMLKNGLKLAKRILSHDGRIIVIYSDLSQILGLSKQTFDQLCLENGFLIEQKHEQPLAEEMVKKSAISEWKSRSHILTYVLKRS